MCLAVCARARAHVRACVCGLLYVCVCVCLSVCVCVYVYVCVSVGGLLSIVQFATRTKASAAGAASTASAPSVLHRLSGHAQDVQCVSWQPTPAVHGADHVVRATHVCCSTSRDKTIVLWDGTTGTQLASTCLPSPKRTKAGGRDKDKDGIWLAHTWLSSAELLTTSYGGDLLKWRVTARQGHAGVGSSSDEGHVADVVVECVAAFPSSGRRHAVFGLQRAPQMHHSAIITVSSDRQITMWNTENMSTLSVLPTMGGHVYDIATSAL